MFWQGGFVFYASVVVPVGREAIGSDQSVVTRQVAVYLNLAGAIVLAPLAWDVWITPSHRPGRWAAWVGMAIGLPVLVWLYGRLVNIIDPETTGDYSAFYPTHRWYLWTSTLQWLCAVVYMLFSLLAWKEVDRKAVDV
jgi:hypothetical protein